MKFLTLGVLAGPLPNNIVDGMVADAAPVMANIQSVVDNINDNIGNYRYYAPVTGFSIVMLRDEPGLILEPLATLAGGTICMPATPADGFIARICTTKLITSLQVIANTNQTVLNVPTTLAAGAGFSMIYRSTNTTWYRMS